MTPPKRCLSLCIQAASAAIIVIFFIFVCSFYLFPWIRADALILGRSYPVDPFLRRNRADSHYYTRVNTVGIHIMPFGPSAVRRHRWTIAQNKHHETNTLLGTNLSSLHIGFSKSYRLACRLRNSARHKPIRIRHTDVTPAAQNFQVQYSKFYGYSTIPITIHLHQ